METELIEIVGESKAKIASMEEDIKEIKENQKVILQFITEQKVGKRFVWALFAFVAAIVALLNDFLSSIPKLFTFKGFH